MTASAERLADSTINTIPTRTPNSKGGVATVDPPSGTDMLGGGKEQAYKTGPYVDTPPPSNRPVAACQKTKNPDEVINLRARLRRDYAIP